MHIPTKFDFISCLFLLTFFQCIPHPAISLAKLELFTRKVATTVPMRLSHRSNFLYYGNPKWLFYVDGSMPFGESGCFACMGALFLQAAGPFISQGAKNDERFTCMGGFFFGPPSSRLSWARQGPVPGSPRQGPMCVK